MRKTKPRTDNLLQVATADRDHPRDTVYLAYLRQSTEDDQGSSFDEQYRDCQRAVEDKGWCLTRERALLDSHLAPDPDNPRRFVGAFGDRMKGIVTPSERVGFGEALAFVNERRAAGRPIAGVVICEQSRFSRQKGWSLFSDIAALLEMKLSVLLADDGSVIDSDSDILTILQVGLRGESNNRAAVDNARKTLRALEKLVEKGLWPGGDPPPGYQVVDAPEYPSPSPKGCASRVVKSGDPLHEELIRAAFTMPYEHGLAATAQYLTQKGLRTSPRHRNNHTPGPITVNVLRFTILLNELYCGLLSWPRRGRPRWPSKKRPATVGFGSRESIVVYRPELAYVSKEKFGKMQDWLRERAGLRGASGQTHLLTGILKCPYHKANLYEDGKGWYRCQHVGECKLKGIPASLIENQVHAAVVLLLVHEKNAAALVERFAETRLEAREKLAQLEDDLETAKRRRKKLLDGYSDVHRRVSDSTVLSAIKALDRQEAQIAIEIELCQKELGLSKEALMGLGVKFYLASPAERNMMLRTMLRKLRVNPKNGLLEMQFTDLLHNLELTVSRYLLLPPSLDESGEGIKEAARAAARLVGETLRKRVSRAAVREYRQKVGEWQDNCIVEFELTQSGVHSPNGKARRIGVMKYVGKDKPPQFSLAERDELSEQVHCGGGI